jgi:hypothetical protein
VTRRERFFLVYNLIWLGLFLGFIACLCFGLKELSMFLLTASVAMIWSVPKGPHSNAASEEPWDASLCCIHPGCGNRKGMHDDFTDHEFQPPLK